MTVWDWIPFAIVMAAAILGFVALSQKTWQRALAYLVAAGAMLLLLEGCVQLFG